MASPPTPATSLNIVRHSGVRKQVLTACWLSGGRIAAGGLGFLDILDKEMNIVRTAQLDCNGHCYCVRSYSDDLIAALVWSSPISKVKCIWLYTQDLLPTKTLHLNQSDNMIRDFSINANEIVVCDYRRAVNFIDTPLHILIYDREKLQRRDIRLEVDVRLGKSNAECHITSDEQYVIVAFTMMNSVRKYRLTGGPPLWVRHDVRKPSAVCLSKSGELYVAQLGFQRQNLIYQLDMHSGNQSSY